VYRGGDFSRDLPGRGAAPIDRRHRIFATEARSKPQQQSGGEGNEKVNFVVAHWVTALLTHTQAIQNNNNNYNIDR